MEHNNKVAVFSKSKISKKIIPSDIDIDELIEDLKLIKSKLGLSTTPETTTELGSDLILSAGQIKEIKGKLKIFGHKILLGKGSKLIIN